MSKATYFLITLFGGLFGAHKFAKKQIGIGILYLLTCGLFGIGWLIDSVKAFIDIFKQDSEIPCTNCDYLASLYDRMNRDLLQHEIIRKYVDRYYKGSEEIESMWSVMYNLKVTSGEKADAFEVKCRQNILDLFEMLKAQEQYGFDSSMPPHVPAYVRLAMLFEKQEKYQKAIDICVEAIKFGAINDGNKGKMYGRLARLIRKSGIDVNDDVLALSIQK